MKQQRFECGSRSSSRITFLISRSLQKLMFRSTLNFQRRGSDVISEVGLKVFRFVLIFNSKTMLEGFSGFLLSRSGRMEI